MDSKLTNEQKDKEDKDENQSTSGSSTTSENSEPSESPSTNSSQSSSSGEWRFNSPDEYENHPFFQRFMAGDESVWSIWRPGQTEYAKLHMDNSIECGPRENFQSMFESEPVKPVSGFSTSPLPTFDESDVPSVPPPPAEHQDPEVQMIDADVFFEPPTYQPQPKPQPQPKSSRRRRVYERKYIAKEPGLFTIYEASNENLHYSSDDE